MRSLLLTILVGCAGDPADQDQRNTPSPQSQLSQTSGPGPTGTNTGASSGLVWVDASGAEIYGVVTLPEGLGHVDINGNIWRLSAWDGELSDFGVLYPRFTDPDCTQPYYALDPTRVPALPRYVLRSEEGDALFVLSDDVVYEMIGIAYLRQGGDCVETEVPIGLPTSAVSVVQPLASSWTAPLHPEMR